MRSAYTLVCTVAHRKYTSDKRTCLILGFGARIAALVLALFTLVASFFFHAYWAVPADQQFVTQLLFMKNIAVVGGLLTLSAWGAGAWSLDARNKG